MHVWLAFNNDAFLLLSWFRINIDIITGRSVQAVPLGAVCLHQGAALPRVAPHKGNRTKQNIATGKLVGQQNFVTVHQCHLIHQANNFFSYPKVVNAERASYAAPNFARMQERTRSQMLEDLVANLQNHAETGQIPKPYR